LTKMIQDGCTVWCI